MIPTITMTQMREIIEESLRLNDKKPMLFLGKTGIGKSFTPLSICQEKGLGHIDIRILNHTETDFKGLPYPDKEREFTIYLQNKMLPIEERDGKEGILVLDEVTSGSRSVRTSIYQLLQERRIGEYKLPDGWQIICLGNGENDGGDFNGMESAFGARCKCFRVETTTEDYIRYGNANGVNDLVLSFVEFSPSSLHTYDSDKDGTEECLGFACNRAWSTVSNLLNNKEITMTNGKLSEIDRINIQGTVGTEEGMKFISFVDLKREVVSCVDIAKGKKVETPKREEVKYMTANGLKNLMCEMVVSSHYNPESQEPPKESLMKGIANCLLWLIENVSIELTSSTIIGFCSKDINAMQLFISDEFDAYCENNKKYKAINDFFEKHDNLFTLS